MKIDMNLRNFAAEQCRNTKSEANTYRHFDFEVSDGEKEKLLECVEKDDDCKTFLNPDFVAHYRQLPYIQFDIKFQKYDSCKPKGKRLTIKSRKIALASHHEALLLKFYAIMLNERYEEYIVKNGIASVPVAYRKNHDNISAAKEVFDFIWQTENVWIVKGDFHAFFDCLNHHVLTQQVKMVLGGNENERLSEDWMTVIKAITKYRMVSKDELNKVCGRRGKDTPYVTSFKQLGKYVQEGRLHLSDVNKKGIPQGTAISAVLANVYMSHFDKEVNELITRNEGMYRRYSDDFIIIVPKKNCSYSKISDIKQEIIEKSKRRLHLKINDKKTQLLEFSKANGHVYGGDSLDKILNLRYLGFDFTGRSVYLRPGTIYKFHYRGRKAIALLVRNIEERDAIQYNGVTEYLSRRKEPWQYKRAIERLKIAKKDNDRGYSIRGRKKTTQMYLVMEPINRQNMMYYAYRAEKIMKKPIAGIDDIYQVRILKKVQKEIAGFQVEYGRRKREKLAKYH